MFWADKIAADAQGDLIVVNDSKTPSGRVHVGSLRGVVIHDVIYRALKHAGKPVKFLYGVDDYDALDTVPKYLDLDKFAPYLGYPLCNTPSPDNRASDYAKYFMGEFLEVFDYLGVKPEVYYLRDLYRTGKLDRYIDLFLNNAHLVREAYKEVSKADRPDNWYPFHPICENCGKIATTVTTAYQDGKVFYTCEPNATNYVNGCGHSGWVSPFGGNGKLPWKVEWVAKWDAIGVSIEMAGKDHSQKGGSRDVANSICRKVLNKQPPFHSPYEFILVNGTKMSSSKGVGSSAKEIAELMPPELLRFLMLRTQPRSVINFSPNYETITRLFRDYDTLISKYQAHTEADANTPISEDLIPLLYAQLNEELSEQKLGPEENAKIPTYEAIDISTLISLLQVPHLDIEVEVEKRSPKPLSDYDWQIVRQRIAVAKKWLQDYADEEEKLVLYLDRVPDKAKSLDAEQTTYLTQLIANLEAEVNWDGEELQTTLFRTAKELEISQKVAFASVYLTFLGKERGPKAGNLLSYLDKSFVIARLQEVLQLNAISAVG
ncbi:lysine--tRNA ligase [Tumidithrix elongata RA019]|uniref:Lysine--tRNA ligase n=1 Tax=Tumidithrix elongata BACA0141 TaxID=2716417 RepID=A0AAW9PWF2_9CYAN|nr:lysine--tRNA ligase [Tumidithrix elongata RA019]